MSDAPLTQPAPASHRVLRPWTMIAGFVLGLALLAWFGRHRGNTDYHTTFTRFHPMIAPDSQYQPTMREMMSIVRARCRADQILVIVGGNSILLGVGQPADQMWTRRLQDLLGDRFAVVNLAYRGSAATDGGAVVAEALRDEFPRQIYIANVAPMQGIPPHGIDTYRFIVLDALAKGWLLPWAPRDTALAQWTDDPVTRDAAREQRFAARADALLAFRDVWNWWTYEKASTFGVPMMPALPQALAARKTFPDAETDYNNQPFTQRFAPAFDDANLAITRATGREFFTADASGAWTPIAPAHEAFRASAQGAFPDPLKARTLLLVGHGSPYYTHRLTAAEKARERLAYDTTLATWRAIGHPILEYGNDFTQDDFGDRSHLTTQGGRKLATTVAPAVKDLASRLGYLKP